ncbi:MAG: hypothetical protein ACK55I_30710, partial [bacterium]
APRRDRGRAGCRDRRGHEAAVGQRHARCRRRSGTRRDPPEHASGRLAGRDRGVHRVARREPPRCGPGRRRHGGNAGPGDLPHGPGAAAAGSARRDHASLRHGVGCVSHGSGSGRTGSHRVTGTRVTGTRRTGARRTGARR